MGVSIFCPSFVMTPDDSDLPPHMKDFYRDYTQGGEEEPREGEDEHEEAPDIFSAPPGYEEEKPEQESAGDQQSGPQEEQPELELSEREQSPEQSSGPTNSGTEQPTSTPQDQKEQTSEASSHQDWGHNDLLHRLGVYESGSMDPEKAEQVERLVRGAEGHQPSGKVFVRGSKYGSNFLIKLGDWVMILLVIGIVGGLGYGGWWGLQKLLNGGQNTQSPTPTAFEGEAPGSQLAGLAQQKGWIYCQPQTSQSQQAAVLQKLPEVITGEARLPRDQEELRQAEGSQTEITENGDRRDMFSPPGAQLVVRYQGETPQVRYITVRFAQTRPFCRALQALGLLPGEAAFQFEQGNIMPQQGNIDPFFQQGQVQMRLENQEVRFTRLMPNS